jgi:protein TonB
VDYVDEQEVEEYIEELDVSEFDEYIAPASVDDPVNIERPKEKEIEPKKEPIRKKVLKKVDKPHNDKITPTVRADKPVSTLGRTQSIYAGNQGNRKVQYRDKVRAALAAHSIYPRSARRRNIEGVGAIEIKVDAKGNVIAHRFIKSTGYHILDQAAIRMIEKATPLPRPVEYNIATPFWISIPIEFKFK